jgi:hypothetical protein
MTTSTRVVPERVGLAFHDAGRGAAGGMTEHMAARRKYRRDVLRHSHAPMARERGWDHDCVRHSEAVGIEVGPFECDRHVIVRLGPATLMRAVRDLLHTVRRPRQVVPERGRGSDSEPDQQQARPPIGVHPNDPPPLPR